MPAFFLGIIVSLAAIAPANAGFFEQLFAPQAKLWQRWAAHDPGSTMKIDHAAWDRFLKRYVIEGDDGMNRVDYGGVTEADRRHLSRYIEQLTALSISHYNRLEQRAFWINLYNALTLRVVLDHYPVASIRDIDISPGLFADGPWGKKLVEIEGEAVSLDDIEHRILRPIWKDPRIHYAVNCAALGCPDLKREAFTGGNTESLFEQGAHTYVNDPRGVHIEAGKLIVSSIYVWFEADFASGGGVLAHLRHYADAALTEKLVKFDTIDDHRYDWSLNDTRS